MSVITANGCTWNRSKATCMHISHLSGKLYCVIALLIYNKKIKKKCRWNKNIRFITKYRDHSISFVLYFDSIFVFKRNLIVRLSGWRTSSHFRQHANICFFFSSIHYYLPTTYVTGGPLGKLDLKLWNRQRFLYLFEFFSSF